MQLSVTLANVNLSVPLLSKQFSDKPSATPMADSPAHPSAGVATTTNGSTRDPYKPDSQLGDLKSLFDPGQCQFPTDKEVAKVNSRVVVADGNKQHEMCCGSMECYSMDRLRDCNHAFENGSDWRQAQTNPFVTVTYPQGMDYFSNDMSVVQGGGDLFSQLFGNLRVSPAILAKFILQHGECNELCDGAFATNSGQRWRITMGCCGQSYTSESVRGHTVPKAMYGLDVFKEIIDEDERQSLMAMVATCLDAMQDMADYTEMKLGNPLPYNDEQRIARFSKSFADGVGAARSRFEDLSIQLKHIDEHEHTAEHKDERNCTHIGYTKTVALCFTVKDAEGLMWSVKLIGNSRAAAGSWEGNVYELPPIFTRIRRQMEQLDHYLDGMMQVQRESGG